MSDLIAVVKVCDEKIICIDFDKPVWISKVNDNLKGTPSLDHFMVDGILATISTELLNKFKITKRFNSEDFEMLTPSVELKNARDILYDSNQLNIEYFYDHEGDIQIKEDLKRFKNAEIKSIRLSTQDLNNASK